MKELAELPLHLEQSARAQPKWKWICLKKIYMLTAVICLRDLLSAYINTS